MILGVDGSRAAGLRTGVGRVLEYLLRSWARHPHPFEEVRVFTPTPVADLPDEGPVRQEVLPGGAAALWWQAMRLRPRAEQVDSFFAPYVLPPGFRGRSVVYNLGIYEGPYAFPGWRARARSRHMAWSARRADRVLAICPTTREDLVRYYGVPPQKIDIAWPGLDPRFRPRREGEDLGREVTAEVFGDDAPYLLFVGKLSLRRNVPSLLEAFARVAPAVPRLRLLLVGPNTAEVPVERLATELGVGARVRQLDDVRRENLVLLFRFARAFVMPTENEGFSLTILEALASGCPVLTLRGAPLGVLEYLDGPRDHDSGGPVLEAADARPGSLAGPLRRLAEDDDLCGELGRRGLRFASSFPSWDEAAGQIAAALAAMGRAGEPRAAIPGGVEAGS